MSYATAGQVTGFNPVRIFTATSVPNSSQVGEYLEQTAAVLDGILREKGYALPIPDTATSALKLLAHLNARGGWALVEQSAKASPHKDKAEALWEEAQKMLHDGLVELDAPTNTQLGLPRAQAAASPFFTRDLEL